MIGFIKNWLQGTRSRDESDEDPRVDSHASHGPRLAGAFLQPQPVVAASKSDDPAAPQPAAITLDMPYDSHVETNGPGKNVLVRNKFVREDTGTHETLRIVDDTMVDTGEEAGIDPYNTGNFDRSRTWDKRFRN